MSKRKELVIVGCGGFAREVAWLAKECPDQWDLIGFLDDNASLQGRLVNDIPVIGSIDEHTKFDAHFVVAVGSPRTRKAIVSRMESTGRVRYATLVHPSALVSKYVEVSEGTIIAAGCVLTTNIRIGRHSIINLSCTIGHDVTAGDFCTFAPQAAISGGVHFGDGVEIGTGAIIIQGLSIGSGSFIGAGSVVTKDIAENVLAAGTPARQVKSLDVF